MKAAATPKRHANTRPRPWKVVREFRDDPALAQAVQLAVMRLVVTRPAADGRPRADESEVRIPTHDS